MRGLRDWRLLATALGLCIGPANTVSVLAHAQAHHRDEQHAHQHASSLESHDGPVELSAGDHAGSHQHVRLVQATRTATHAVVVGPPVTTTVAEFDLARGRVAEVRAASVPIPDPPGDDPPRLRAPPLH